MIDSEAGLRPGKCERHWEAVGRELWDKTHPRDLDESREQLTRFDARRVFTAGDSLGMVGRLLPGVPRRARSGACDVSSNNE